jgi:hypothetical protein
MFIAILTLLSALSISGVAIFYSVIGLATIFPGAFVPVVIMGGVLEVGKLITASWLYRNWKFTPFMLRTYLTTAVIILSLDNINGYLWFPIQGTPGTELGIRHTDTTYTDIRGQDRQREKLNP